jgi:hypothetical protein
MKHVGKMKNNGARVAVAFRTIPGDPHSALVIGTNGLADAYHDSLMSLIESEGAQLYLYDRDTSAFYCQAPSVAELAVNLQKNKNLS